MMARQSRIYYSVELTKVYCEFTYVVEFMGPAITFLLGVV